MMLISAAAAAAAVVCGAMPTAHACQSHTSGRAVDIEQDLLVQYKMAVRESLTCCMCVWRVCSFNPSWRILDSL